MLPVRHTGELRMPLAALAVDRPWATAGGLDEWTGAPVCSAGTRPTLRQATLSRLGDSRSQGSNAQPLFEEQQSTPFACWLAVGSATLSLELTDTKDPICTLIETVDHGHRDASLEIAHVQSPNAIHRWVGDGLRNGAAPQRSSESIGSSGPCWPCLLLVRASLTLADCAERATHRAFG